jgi:hypothetical protein
MSRPSVLFLDIDGCLNSRRFFVDRYNGADPDGMTWEESQIDPAAVAMLNRILAETGAEVVISSTWRLMHRLPDLRGILRRRGFTGRIIDRTPDLNDKPRGLEIQAWLDAQREQPPAFAIVDDDEDMAHLSHRLVRTTFAEGLTEADASRLIAMLRGGS